VDENLIHVGGDESELDFSTFFHFMFCLFYCLLSPTNGRELLVGQLLGSVFFDVFNSRINHLV
jgi:hypothetical protein